LAYVAAEMLGAIFGALLSAFADPTAPSLWLWSFDGLGPGCVPQLLMPEVFLPIFVWEVAAHPVPVNRGPSSSALSSHALTRLPPIASQAAGTFVLCSTVFATAVAQPGAGSVAPLAIGLSVAVNVGTSGAITGGCYNPARVLGPALVYGCRLHLIWLYLAAEAFGALAAALWHLHVSAPVLPAEQVALRGREAPSSSCCESSGAEMMSTAPL
jgi:hypothetical protein